MALPSKPRDLIKNTIQDVELKNGRKILALHQPEQIEDTNGNGDDVFQATNIDQAKRYPEHGYEPGQDEAVYDQTNVGDIQAEAENARAAVLARALSIWNRTASNAGEVS